MALNWQQIGQDIYGEAAGDNSGWSTSMSSDGKRIAIGAYKNDGNGTDSGSVRIYEDKGATANPRWQQVGQDIDGEAAADQSGYSISISGSGTRVAIGAPQNDGNGNNAGQVRIYEDKGVFATPRWQQIGQDIDGKVADEYAGSSVSISTNGNRVAIASSDTVVPTGRVVIYEDKGEFATPRWQQIGQDINGEATGDAFGVSISITANGTRVAIGSPQNDGNGTDSGSVRIYEDKGATATPRWQQVGQDIDGEAAGDNSGYSISISGSGTRVAIGAKANDGSSTNSGQVRVYEDKGATANPRWQKIGQDIDGTGVYSGMYQLAGYAVAISSNGMRVFFSQPENAFEGSTGKGRIFEDKGATANPRWQQVGQDILGSSNDKFGLNKTMGISSNGSTVVFASTYRNSNTGVTKVYYIDTPPDNTTCFGRGTQIVCVDSEENESKTYLCPIENVVENVTIVKTKDSGNKKVHKVLKGEMLVDFEDYQKCMYMHKDESLNLRLTGHHGVFVKSLENHKCKVENALEISDGYLIPAASHFDYKMVPTLKQGDLVEYYHICLESEKDDEFFIVFASKNEIPVETISKATLL